MLHTKPTALFDNAIDIDNPIFDTDSYKLSHYKMYAEGVDKSFAYIEPRKAYGDIDEVVFFGLQMELAKLQGNIWTQTALNVAAPELLKYGYDINVKGIQKIIDTYGGRTPVRIDALPEGTVAPVSVPQVRVQTDDPDLVWLSSFLETRLLRAVWYPSTVASISRYGLREIKKRMLITDGHTEGVEFKFHDFGARGVSSFETAGIGALAHLVNARGTDTSSALIYGRNFYGADTAGYSIPASEHSIMTQLGREGERTMVAKVLEAYPSGLLANVSDSYDHMDLVRNGYGKQFREQILGRDGVFVVRPDSGDPLEIVLDTLAALMESFGYTYTETGYKLLPPQVRVIQGDGIGIKEMIEIMDAMMERGYAIGNIAFGMGGGLLQKVNRDMFGYAQKLSAVEIDGVWNDVFKDPITAGGTKTSKKGRLGVLRNDHGAMCTRPIGNIPKGYDAMVNVFDTGMITNLQTFDQVRANAAI